MPLAAAWARSEPLCPGGPSHKASRGTAAEERPPYTNYNRLSLTVFRSAQRFPAICPGQVNYRTNYPRVPDVIRHRPKGTPTGQGGPASSPPPLPHFLH